MHRTLKAETAKPPRETLGDQQKTFDAWRQQFNHERPHEALKMQTPADKYVASARRMPDELPDPDYPTYFEARRVRKNGCLKFNYREIPLGMVLGAEAVGIEPIDNGVWQFWFGPIYLGTLTEQANSKSNFNRNFPYTKQP